MLLVPLKFTRYTIVSHPGDGEDPESRQDNASFFPVKSIQAEGFTFYGIPLFSRAASASTEIVACVLIRWNLCESRREPWPRSQKQPTARK